MLLDGVKVVSFTHFLQGPSAVQFLADLGADVVKVEPPHGAWERDWSGADNYLNGESVFFMLANRNQRSIVLDLKSERGAEAARRLVAEADVVVENYRPGVLERLGLGYDDVRALNPSVVYGSCSGYGPGGPRRKEPGQDLLVQALYGLAAQTGGADAPPTPVGTSVIDQHAASLAALGVLAALFRRVRTGDGARVDVSLLSAALDLQIEPFTYFLNGARLAARSGAGLASRFHHAPYGVHATSDGWMVVSHASLEGVIEATGAEQELGPFREADAFEAREGLSEALGRVLRGRTTAEWLDLFGAADVWCAPVRDYEEIVDDPQLAWNATVEEYEHPRAGRVRYLTHPVRYDGKGPALRRRPPLLGEHTEEILAELGLAESASEPIREVG